MKNKNPLNKDEKDRQKTEVARVEPDLESDKFGVKEQKAIVKMVKEDYEHGIQVRAEWKTQKMLDILHVSNGAPSKIEGLTKKNWMSDRNLGLAAALCDIYQAVLLSTCYNPDSIHFVDTEENDINNKDNLEKFTKWALGPSEADFFPEIDDYIHNKVNLGWSVFKIEWEVTYQWVDKRIPVYAKEGNTRRIIKYDIKTEKRRFERGRIRNIDELDDILTPAYGKDIHELPWFAEILHPRLDTLVDFYERGIIVNFNEEKQDAIKAALQQPNQDKLRKVDEDAHGATTTSAAADESSERSGTIDIVEYYGFWTKNGKREMYRFWVELSTETFLAGKPLRKIMRDGKIPYEGGPLRRRPGYIRGGSLPSLIAPAINALNNNYNQTSDYQTIQNIPQGYYDKNQEGLDSSIQEFEAGKLTPVDGDPSKVIYFPNLSRSLAWSYQDKQFLMEIIERQTGAASYFQTTQSKQTTATRDTIVEEKGQTKFGLWVKRTMSEISRTVNRFVGMYQDWAPPNLGTRILGEDGKAIIKNLSIDDLRGNYDAVMIPDITQGSKMFEKTLALFAAEAMQSCVWLDPRMNPRGNWLMWEFILKKQGFSDPAYYMPPQPKVAMDYSKEAENHFEQLKQGDKPEPPAADNPQIVECVATFMRLQDTRYGELAEEYRPNFDDYFFRAQLNYRKFMTRIQTEMMAAQIASKAAMALESVGGGMAPQAPAAGPVAPPNRTVVGGQQVPVEAPVEGE